MADAGVDLLILELAGSNWLPGLQAAVSTGLPVWIGPMAALAEAGEVLAIQSDDVVSTPIVATEDSDPFGTELNRLLTENGAAVVSWLRDDHLCVISGRGVSSATLLRLASWSDRDASAS